MSRLRHAGRFFGAAAALVLFAGCGKKGPPLAPLHLVPSRIEDVKATRRGSDIELRFTLPKTNVNGPGPVRLDRVDVYAVTVAPGATPPANRELMTKAYLVGSVAVKPLPEEGSPPQDTTTDDKRPSPGERAVFTEALTETTLQPTPVKKAVASALEKAPNPLPFVRRTGLRQPARVYVLRGAADGRPGAPSAQIPVPLAMPPPPPSDLNVGFTEQVMTVNWAVPEKVEEPPEPELADWMFLAPQFPYLFFKAPPPATSFNVYREGQTAPLNPEPVTTAEFVRPGVEFGASQCYVVRTVQASGSVTVESVASEPVCVTPVDLFPPAAPRGLQVVAAEGEINLSWNANTEKDLAGYIVLRAEATGATLQALTPAPIGETRYRDAAVKTGMRYVYAIVAVDKAVPPNMSAQSAQADETAR